MEKTFKKTSTGVVINTNKAGLLKAKQIKRKKELEKERIDQLEKDFLTLSQDVKKILEILQGTNGINSDK